MKSFPPMLALIVALAALSCAKRDAAESTPPPSPAPEASATAPDDPAKLAEEQRREQEKIRQLEQQLAQSKDDAERKALAEKLAEEQAKETPARGTRGGHGPRSTDNGPCTCAPGDPLCSCMPEPAPAQAVVEGNGLPREQIMKVVSAHDADVRACYERQRKIEPALEGKVMMRFTIGAKGDVADAGVVSTSFATPDVPACITKEIRKWKFPAPGGEQKVETPYAFSPD